MYKIYCIIQKYIIYKENKGRYTKYATAISGENGIARFEKVIYGGYRLVETKAPEGYIGSNEVKTFILDGKGSKLIKFNYENKETKLRIVKVEKIAGAFATEEEALEGNAIWSEPAELAQNMETPWMLKMTSYGKHQR